MSHTTSIRKAIVQGMREAIHPSPRVVRYSDKDIVRLLCNYWGMPHWEKSAHIFAAAEQRGYSGDRNQSIAERFLEGCVFP